MERGVCVYRPAVHYGYEVHYGCVTMDGEKLPGHSQHEQFSIPVSLHNRAPLRGKMNSQATVLLSYL